MDGSLLVNINSFFNNPKNTVRSCKIRQLRHQLKSLVREITRLLNMPLAKAMKTLAIYAAVPSCLNHKVGWFTTAGLKYVSNIVRCVPPLKNIDTQNSF